MKYKPNVLKSKFSSSTQHQQNCNYLTGQVQVDKVSFYSVDSFKLIAAHIVEVQWPKYLEKQVFSLHGIMFFSVSFSFKNTYGGLVGVLT